MAEGRARRISIPALGFSLGTFFVISYVICILRYLADLIPGIRHDALSVILPGFTLLSWGSFFLGLAESFVWGWYVALVFAPLHNYFAAKFP